MSHLFPEEFLIEVKKGGVKGHSTFRRYGRNDNIPNGATEIIHAEGGSYTWLQTAVPMEVASTNLNDAPGLGGCETVLITGVLDDWTWATETQTLDGLTPVRLDNDYIRIIRIKCMDNGQYSPPGANLGIVEIRELGAGALHAIVAIDRGQTQMSRHTVELGTTAYFLGFDYSINSGKFATLRFWERPEADRTNAPFRGKREIFTVESTSNPSPPMDFDSHEEFEECADLWWEATSAAVGTSVHVEYELLVVENAFLPPKV